MKWLSRGEGERIGKTYTQLQVISVMADRSCLRHDIPLEPAYIPTAEGPPSNMHEWYGMTSSNRFVLLQAVATETNQNASVLIFSPYCERGTAVGEWTILLDLVDLPGSVFLSRPLSVQSRASNTWHVVYRPHPQGWNDAIYRASSRADAEDFLGYLEKDSFNRGCFIDAAEREGEWAIIERNNGVDVITGAYPFPSDAMRVGAQRAQRWGKYARLIVRNLSDTLTDSYIFEDGTYVRHAAR